MAFYSKQSFIEMRENTKMLYFLKRNFIKSYNLINYPILFLIILKYSSFCNGVMNKPLTKNKIFSCPLILSLTLKSFKSMTNFHHRHFH